MSTVAGAGGRVAIVLNPHTGGRDQSETGGRIVELFAARGVDAILVPWPEARDFAAVVSEAAKGATTVVAAGGDGTVSAVAAPLVGTSVRLGVLGLGTLNHFAKDAGIPLALEKAVDVIVAGHERAVDVGEVNGRTFLNNCSVGVYPTIVRSRENLERDGHGKWWSLMLSALRILPRHPRMRVTFEADGRTSAWRTAFVMVANNAYDVTGVHFGARSSLSDGQLAAYLAPHIRARDLPASVMKAMFAQFTRRGDRSLEEFRVVPAKRLRIGIEGSTSISIAIDGEVSTTPLPLDCRIRPAALRVLVPES